MKTIVLYLSGNLAAKTIVLLSSCLLKNSDYQLILLTDGYVPENDDADLPLRRYSVDEASRFFSSASLFVTSIRSPGDTERQLIRLARSHNLKSVVILADLGSGAQKFRDAAGWALPDWLTVTDCVTRRILIEQGVPSDIIVRSGSPYLDEILHHAQNGPLPLPSNLRWCYYAVPNTLDFQTYGIENHYHETAVVAGIVNALKSVEGATLRIRLHPKEFEQHPYEQFAGETVTVQQPAERPTIEEEVLRHGLGLSTYSTALLVTRILGLPAISYQPAVGPSIRSELYRSCGIPLVRTEDELRDAISEVTHTRPQAPLANFLYNEGSSLEKIAGFILDRAG